MTTTLTPDSTRETLARLRDANADFSRRYPGESGRRQPVHTVYGGAQLFKRDSARRLGGLGLRALEQYAPDFFDFARAVGLPGAETLPESERDAAALRKRLESDPQAIRREHRAAWLAFTVYARVVAKLRQEPVEDFRIDFEDGYGNRPHPEEDGHAAAAASEVADGMASGELPPFIGIRIKPFNEELRMRSIRTLDIFLTTLAGKTGARLPENFVVTLPKITHPAQVAALADLFDLLEPRLKLPAGSLKIEMMVETTQSIFDPRGGAALPALVEAARGRCLAAHFGTYDYT
ncbi:MAG: DUF6986 family protein, partial [Candidatus Acidiferrales bacterium]